MEDAPKASDCLKDTKGTLTSNMLAANRVHIWKTLGGGRKSVTARASNSFGVKSVYVRIIRKPIGLAEQRARCAHLEVACTSPGVSVTSFFFELFCFRARLGRKYERSDPRVDFYSTPSCIMFVKGLNL